MASRTVDPASLTGEALTRWYRRTPEAMAVADVLPIGVGAKGPRAASKGIEVLKNAPRR